MILIENGASKKKKVLHPLRSTFKEGFVDLDNFWWLDSPTIIPRGLQQINLILEECWAQL